MPVTIDIDTGGTFTDGVFTRDGRVHGVKVLTTPHDLTVGMLECVDAGAAALGLAPEDMLADTEVVRFSSTIVTNAVIERRGPAVGVLVSAGSSAAGGLVSAGLVRGDLVAPVDEPVDPAVVAQTVEGLLDAGARVLVASLEGSWVDPAAERAVRTVVHDLFPPYFLGAVRVFLASDLSALPGTAERTNTAVLNAFVHDRLARSVYKAEEDLRRRGLRRPLMVVHGHAGLARAAKTLAIHTYNSGPVAGVRGAATRGAGAPSEGTGSKIVVTLDIGGTSADLSLADADGLAVSWTAEVAGLPAHLPAVSVDALAVGGGSIAWMADGAVQVGPRSAGAHPGPACFDRGGTDPTLTDANLVLGRLDPAGFHGGRLPLVASAAEAVLAPLANAAGTDVAGVARRIVAEAEAKVAAGIGDLLARRGVQPSEAVLVAYGGGGPLHAAGVAARAGLCRVVVPAHSAVFSALGVSGLDVGHVYPLSLTHGLDAEGLEGLLEVARRDMVAEGFAAGGISSQVEVVDPTRAGAVLWRQSFAGIPAAGAWREDAAAAASGQGGTPLLVLTVTAPTHHAEAAAAPAVVADATGGEQPVDWGDGPVPTAVLSAGGLAAGSSTTGPALVTAPDTTIAVPPGWSATRRTDGAVVLEGA